MNNSILKGRISCELELKTTQSGFEYVSFSVAVDRYMGKDKEKQTDFIPCKAWGKTAAFITTYFGKGKEILLSGAIQIDKYEKDGENRTYTYVNVSNVEFCGSKSDSGQANNSNPAPASFSNKGSNDFADLGDASDDDLPF